MLDWNCLFVSGFGDSIAGWLENSATLITDAMLQGTFAIGTTEATDVAVRSKSVPSPCGIAA